MNLTEVVHSSIRGDYARVRQVENKWRDDIPEVAINKTMGTIMIR